MCQEIKKQVIECILKKVETGPVFIYLDSAQLFYSIPVWIPHAPEQSEVKIELEVSKDGVKYKYDEEILPSEPEWNEEDLEDGVQWFEFRDLTLLQLVLILESIKPLSIK